MSNKTKKVSLGKAMSWGGVNYAPGINTMPEAAAASAVKRKLGVFADEGSLSEASKDFTPLSFAETMTRFEEGDSSDEVFQSLKHYQPLMAEAKKSGTPFQEFIEAQSAAAGSGTETKTTEGLPEEFPFRTVYEKLGFKSVEEVQALSREKLIELDGVGEKTADAALAYGK